MLRIASTNMLIGVDDYQWKEWVTKCMTSARTGFNTTYRQTSSK